MEPTDAKANQGARRDQRRASADARAAADDAGAAEAPDGTALPSVPVADGATRANPRVPHPVVASQASEEQTGMLVADTLAPDLRAALRLAD